MDSLQAFILGIVQGITEFLPVSSSGHLILFQSLLGLDALSHFLLFDLICHMGTLAAIFLVFRKEVLAALKSTEMLKLLGVAILPLFPLLLAVKQIKSTFESPELLGYFYLFSTILLLAGVFSKEKVPAATPTWKGALWIGLFQALAIFPGVSRSGATISAALLLGWSLPSAVQFSFLLAIPTILGGFAYESLKYFTSPTSSSVSPEGYAIGFLLSFAVGSLALLFLKGLKSKKMLIPFALYCFLLGSSLIVWSK